MQVHAHATRLRLHIEYNKYSMYVEGHEKLVDSRTQLTCYYRGYWSKITVRLVQS